MAIRASIDCPSALGFLLKRSSSDVCGRYLHSRRTAVITSPFFPSNYPNNTDCLWRIRAAKRRVLVITITTLDTEEGYDYLEIKQGRWYTISPFVGRYTGKVNRTMQLTLNSNSAWIRFRSDELINSVGFRLVYRAERESNAISCPVLISSTIYLFVVEIRCPRIPAPANGMKLHQNRTVGGVVLFKCDDGYRMVGKRRIKCLAIGKWNSESPSCVGMTAVLTLTRNPNSNHNPNKYTARYRANNLTPLFLSLQNVTGNRNQMVKNVVQLALLPKCLIDVGLVVLTTDAGRINRQSRYSECLRTRGRVGELMLLHIWISARHK